LRACFLFRAARNRRDCRCAFDHLNQETEAIMKSLIGAILAGAALVLAGAATIGPAGAAPKTVAQTAGTFDASRHDRRFYRHYGNRPYHQPRYYAYYDRPYYYRPYPYSVPAPFTFGFAFDPAWW
jgi:hypothetical protein